MELNGKVKQAIESKREMEGWGTEKVIIPGAHIKGANIIAK